MVMVRRREEEGEGRREENEERKTMCVFITGMTLPKYNKISFNTYIHIDDLTNQIQKLIINLY